MHRWWRVNEIHPYLLCFRILKAFLDQMLMDNLLLLGAFANCERFIYVHIDL